MVIILEFNGKKKKKQLAFYCVSDRNVVPNKSTCITEMLGMLG